MWFGLHTVQQAMAALQHERVKLYAVPAAREFAEAVRAQLGADRVEPCVFDSFACGETRVEVGDSVRGYNVYIVGWGAQCKRNPMLTVNESYVQLMIAINAFQLASARTITVVYPNLPYSRQDRKDASRQPITASMVARTLEALGCTRVITMDLHAAQVQGMYRIPVDNLYGTPAMLEAIAQTLDKVQPVAVVSPDAGGRKRMEGTEERLRTMGFADIALVSMDKKRDPKMPNTILSQEIRGDPAGRNCVLVDDLADTCGTLCRAADLLRTVEGGVLSVSVAITHGVFSNDAVDKLASCKAIDVVYVTDTCLDAKLLQGHPKFKVMSVAREFSDSIVANETLGGSVSHQFSLRA